MRSFLRTFYASPNIIRAIKSRRMICAGQIACMRNKKCKKREKMVGKPEGKRPLGRPRSRWEDNIGMDLREMGWQGVDWIHPAQDWDQRTR
jgi:hypothetical protein